jgi:argininosuccinate synthase
MYKLSVSPEDAPDKAEYVDLAFEKGNCVKVVGGTRAVVSQTSRSPPAPANHGKSAKNRTVKNFTKIYLT